MRIGYNQGQPYAGKQHTGIAEQLLTYNGEGDCMLRGASPVADQDSVASRVLRFSRGYDERAAPGTVLSPQLCSGILYLQTGGTYRDEGKKVGEMERFSERE